MHDTAVQDATARTALRPETCLWCLALGFLTLILIATVLEIDVQVSQVFYHPATSPRWFLSEVLPWRWLYYGEYPIFCLAVAAAVVCVASLRYRPWERYRRPCALFVLAVALGPGILVNVLVKPLWGRPRPKQTELFGSSRPYRHWWQPGQIGGGKSLPSGHASMGYALLAGTCMLSARRSAWVRRGVLAAALTYGSLLGFTRIVQGGHFATDVLWSGCLMCALVALLQRLLPGAQQARSPNLVEGARQEGQKVGRVLPARVLPWQRRTV
ncbi:MAG: phosphatase PAP2 family protein [Candidatus Tectimicrobiota bacterium]